MSDVEQKTGVVTDVRPDKKNDKPKMYKIIMHNDDYTTAEFVVETLREVFNKARPEAFELMTTAHTLGKALIVVLAKDAAETKLAEAMEKAKTGSNPYLDMDRVPFLFTMEPE